MKKLATLILIILPSLCFAQSKYLVIFKDKAGTNYTVSKPSEFLSERSIARRTNQKIEITEHDLPVSSLYLKKLSDAGIQVVYTSKWLNAALIDIPKEKLIQIRSFDFVKEVEGDFANGLGSPNSRKATQSDKLSPVFDSGSAQNQLEMLGVSAMHNKGFKGKGVLIGLLDSGYLNANKLDVFKHLFDDNRILETYNFVFNTTSVYDSHSHGTSVLSCIAADLSGEMVGTAPEASFVLYVTEDVRSETRLEEVNWLIAAERADSVGVDILGSSLGYSDFDGTDQDYSYADMNGKTALITRAADWAASKGILVVVSAGNEGNKTWKYITAPADATNAISVAAVDSNQKYASFSSVGPSADNRIKPDIAAKGYATTIASPENYVRQGNGTSYAAPLITGLVAGLRQAFPDITSADLRRILLESGSQSNQPDNLLGYGVPDFSRAYDLATIKRLGNISDKPILVFPNPSEKNQRLRVLVVKDNPGNNFNVSIVGLDGRLYYKQTFKQSLFDLPVSSELGVPRGNYILKITSDTFSTSERIIIE
jgi:serine protease AprX